MCVCVFSSRCDGTQGLLHAGQVLYDSALSPPLGDTSQLMIINKKLFRRMIES